MTHEEKIIYARTRMEIKAKRKKRHDNANKSMFRFFEISEEILLKANNVSDNEKQEIAKSFSKYEGPYMIQRKVGEVTYILYNEITHEERD